MRPARLAAEKPAKTTECTAPMRAHASCALRNGFSLTVNNNDNLNSNKYDSNDNSDNDSNDSNDNDNHSNAYSDDKDWGQSANTQVQCSPNQRTNASCAEYANLLTVVISSTE